ncbi:hypothetical protein CDL15_Pgr012429 [Punica granatum]|uniref:Uncharacterized protein n=1 Tax=Punica granatum TaxID=22663 RepID=A0A218WY48_PUNGR|nr:hypothetical protein CDL15_Pgr012429 [Punica granatum]
MQVRKGANWPGRHRASTLRDMHRVRRGYVHGGGGGMLARRGRTHSVALEDVLGYAKRRVIDHMMTLGCVA